ncbi:Rpn family recombination-promoting nuclease/putative transposase [Heyndrickxia coagulans]|uniref:Rpn family recombination-promoting nuclease/putative transposase n=1 Tax=Heyndrickxia coagulans TaxID=1398 RepID=UPI002235693C|nr:Rpn family recombination-promoting nuclease/putative transposase [Heyndrickxia coagulans]UZH06081.1 Rpn family recombination-promoting nuclease/putative transposase [Heyndrickxia coagulans]
MQVILEKRSSYPDHDRLFKELIQTFFEEFMDAFFPEESVGIDFSHVKFLSQELHSDIATGEQKRVDILAETKRRGEETVILIHIESQSYYQKNFPERMYDYFSMIRQKYRKPILPIAIFSYNNQKETPDFYTYQFHNLEILRFHYLQVHLIRKNWKDYIRSNNPVAAALLSKMGYKENERVQVKLEFLRMIAHMELEPARMSLVYGFFESYLKLDKMEEEAVMENIKNLEPEEAEQILRLPNSYFDRGYEKGKEVGKQEAAKTIAVKMLSEQVGVKFIEKITGLSQQEISALKKQLEN